MNKVLAIILVLALGCLAAQKTVVVKVARADTVVTIKVDTIKTVVWDTLVITKTVNDTVITLKTDTVKVQGTHAVTPAKIVKPTAKK